MKKSLFMLSAAALTLASCSQEEVLNVATGNRDSKAIAFQAHTGKATRANDFNTSNLEAFKVFGYTGDINDLQDLHHENGSVTDNDLLTDYFGQAVEFTRTNEMWDGENGTGYLFTSEKPYYWPSDFSPLSFFAYAPTSLAMTANNKGEMHLDGFTVDENIENQIDIIADCTPGRRDNDSETEEYPVMPFWFNHALAKVYVAGAWCSDERFTYQVAGVKLGRVYKKGDYIFNKLDKLTIYENLDETPLADNELLSTDDHLYHFWTADKDSRGDFTYIFDEPVTIGTTETPIMNGGIDENGVVDKKGSFLMIPQQLICTPEKEYDANENVRKYKFDDNSAYIALLIRITYDMGEGKDPRVVYPYAKGVDQISETIDGVKYAWAAFPVGSLWGASFYTRYLIDFSEGAGFVAPGSEGVDIVEVLGEDPVHKDLDYSPILGDKIRFIEEVLEWNSGSGNTVDQINGEGVVDEAGFNDPDFDFGD
ncbi:MAG: fimbrillin family protein [Muribaculaceae bacterium]|nr:fimbrillin family protein [Muribaculaceae bacterium]